MITKIQNGSMSFGNPIYKGNTKGQDNFSSSIATSYTANKGDVVFMWRCSSDTNAQGYKNNQPISFTKVNKINGYGSNVEVIAIVAEQGDVFRFDDRTSTSGYGYTACGISVMPIK